MVKSGLRGGVLAALALACVACGGSPTTVPDPNATASAPPSEPVAADRCGAGDLQWLVGEPRTSIPVPVDVSHRRVTCTTCPITEDYSETRLNIFYNRESGLVERVFCG